MLGLELGKTLEEIDDLSIEELYLWNEYLLFLKRERDNPHSR